MNQHPRKLIPTDLLTQAIADEELDAKLESESIVSVAAVLMIIESLGSWQAAEAIGAFDILYDDEFDTMLDQLWDCVPISRGGGGTTLEANINWNKLIAELRSQYPKLESTTRQIIDERRRENMTRSAEDQSA